MTPLLQFPTTTLFIASDADFLLSLKQNVMMQYPRLYCQDIMAATRLLEMYRFEIAEKISLSDDEGNLNFDAIYHIAAEQLRFYAISTIVADYSHENLEFFARLLSPIKKILLVEKKAAATAIEALNNKIIDYVIVKDVNTLADKLHTYLKHASLHYFNALSQTLLLLSAASINLNSRYQQLKQQFLAEFDIIEFYQIDDLGSGVGLNSHGTAHWLAISRETQVHEYLDVANYYQVTDTFLQKLHSHEYLLFLPSEQERKISPEHWEHYLFAVSGNFLHQGEPFYYANIHGNSFSLPCGPSSNYEQFMFDFETQC